MAQSYYLRIAGVIENMSAFINEEGNYYEIFGTGGGEKLAQELGFLYSARFQLIHS